MQIFKEARGMKEIFLELYKKKQIVHSYEREISSDVPTTPLFACYLWSIALEMLQKSTLRIQGPHISDPSHFAFFIAVAVMWFKRIDDQVHLPTLAPKIPTSIRSLTISPSSHLQFSKFFPCVINPGLARRVMS